MKRKLPLRTCIGCGLIRPKREMVRIVVGENGQITVDITGKAAGRGAYLCRVESEIKQVQDGTLPPKQDNIFTVNSDCKEKALTKNAFRRSFRKNIKENFILGDNGKN